MTLKNLESYGPDFQIKVISSLLTHKDFLRNIHDILNPLDFTIQAHQWIINNILKYYKEYNTTPSMEVLKVELKKIDNEVLQISIKEHLREAYAASETDLKYVKDEFSNFCRNQQVKKALLESVELLKDGEYSSIRRKLDNALKAGQDRNLGHEYKKEVTSRYVDNRTVLPTPWDDINDLLQGGLGNGDLGIIFGNPGGGKSWTLVDIGSYAIKLGYNVLHFTLELGEIYVGRRYDARLSEIPVTQLSKNQEDIEEILLHIPGQLIIREYAPRRATMHTLEVHYQKCIDMGIKPDLILIDYLDLLSSTNRSIKDRKDSIDDVYIEAKGMARELNIPIWSVSQVNRAGAQDDIIEGDKAAGSYDKIMIGDFVASLSRKRKDKLHGTGRFHIIKNRYGVDGITYETKADLSIGKFEFFEFNEDEYNKEQETEASLNKKGYKEDISSEEKAKLREKFFKLNPSDD